MLFAIIVIVIVIADQYTKSLATTFLADGKIIKPFGGDFIWYIYVLNPGFAFGFRILPPLVLKIFATVAALILGYYLYSRSADSLIQNLPLSLIMGGAIGNLIDRIRIGEVIDFISVDMPDFFMDRFPVFNVADSMVSIGVTLLIIHSVFFHREEKAKSDLAVPLEVSVDEPANDANDKAPEKIPLSE